jgi:Spy/CpxP family protein refolding chaperone
MKTISMFVMITLATALTASAGSEHGNKNKGDREGGPWQDREARMERVADELELTQEQREQLKALSEEGREEMRALHEAMREARETTAALIEAEVVDRDAVMKSVVAEGAAYLALSKARAEQQIARREILGPEKSAQLGNMRQEWMDDRGGRPMGRGKGKGGY